MSTQLVFVKNLLQTTDGARIDAVDLETDETLYKILIVKEGLFLCHGNFTRSNINDQIPCFPFDLLVAMMEVIVEWHNKTPTLKNNNDPWRS